MNKNNCRGLLAVFLGNTIFGFSFLFSKLALGKTLPSVLLAIRFSIAFFVLSIVVWIGVRIKKSDGTSLLQFSLKEKPLKDVFLLSLFQPIIYYIAENYGILYSSSSFAGIIVATAPISGLLFDFFVLKTKVSKIQICCAFSSILGVILTAFGSKDVTSSLKGVFFLLIAVSTSALFYLFSKRSAKYFSSLERTYIMFANGAVFYILIAACQSFGHYKELILTPLMDSEFLISVVYLAVISSVLAFLLLNYSSPYISITQGTMFSNFTTVISIAAGVLILHESFMIIQYIGAAIIIASVYIFGVQGLKQDFSN